MASDTTISGVLTISSGAALDASNYTINLSGTTGTPFVKTGTFTPSTSTFIYSGNYASGNITIAATTYNNLQINNAAETYSISGSITLNGDFTATAGTLIGGGTFYINGGDISGDGTITFTGTFRVDGTGNFGGSTDWTFVNLVFGDGSGTTTTTKIGSNNISISGVMTVAASQTLDAGNTIWSFTTSTSPFVVNGSVIPSASTFRYTQASTTNVTGTNYFNLLLDHSGTYFIAAGDMTVSGVLTVTAGTTFHGSTRTITLSGSGTPFAVAGSFTASTSTVKYTGADSVNISSQSYKNLTLDHAATNFIFTGNAAASGIFTNTTSPSTITFSSGSTYTFNTINIAGTSGGLITLAPTSDANWIITPTVITAVTYVDVSGSTNAGTAFCATYSNDGGGNVGWNIGAGDTCVAGIVNVSGDAKEYDEVTNVPDGEIVKMAVNNALVGQTGITSGGSWLITGVTQPNPGDAVTIFIDSVADAHEANLVTKYDGTGDMTGCDLFEKHLTIGSDDHQILSNADIAAYDNSVSGNENIFFDVDDSTVNLTLPAQGTQFDSDQKLIVLPSNTWRPNSVFAKTSTMPNLVILASAIVNLDNTTLVLTGSGDPLLKTGTFTYGTSTVKFQGTSATNIAAATYYNLYTDHTGTTFTAAGNINVNGVFTINAGTFDASDKTIILAGSTAPFIVNGTFSQGTSTFKYTGTSATNIAATTYHNLYLDRFGNTFTAAGDFTCTGIFTINSGIFDASNKTITLAGSGTPFVKTGTFTPSTSTIKYSGNLATNVTASTYNNLYFDHTGTTFTAAGDISASNIFTINAGTFDASNRTITLSGSGTPLIVSGILTPSTSTFKYTGTSATNITGTNFYNLYLDHTGTTFAAAGDISASNVLTINSGTFDASNKTITLSGPNTPMVITGTFTSSTSTFKYTGDLSVNVVAASYYNLYIDHVGSIFSAAGDMAVSNIFTINTGTFNALSRTITLSGGVSGPLVVSGILNPSTSTFKYTGNYPDHNIDVAPTTYFNLYLDNASETFVAAGDITISNILTINSGTFDASNRTINLTGSATPFVKTGTFTPSTSTIKYTGSSATNVTPTNYFNLYLDHTATIFSALGDINVGNVLTINTGNFSALDKTITLSGSNLPFIINDTFDPGTSTFKYSGSNATNIAATTYFNLYLDHSGTTYTAVGDITAIGTLTINSGTFDASNKTITLMGSGTPFIINGTFLASTSTFIYHVFDKTNITAADYYNLQLVDPAVTPYVWVVNSDSKITKIDTTNGSTVGSYPVSESPCYGLAVDGHNNLWVANYWANSVSKINGATGTAIGTYPTGNAPWGVAVDGSGNIWVTNTGGSSVTKLSGATGATIGTYGVGINPEGIAIDRDGNVWVANTGSNNVMKLNGTTGATIFTHAVGSRPMGIAVDSSGNAWVGNWDNYSVTKINGSTNATIGTYSVHGNPYGIAIDQSGNVWVTNHYDNSVSKLNGSTGAVLGTYIVGTFANGDGWPNGISIDQNGNAWVVNTNNIKELSGTTGAILGTYPVSNPYISMGDSTGFARQVFADPKVLTLSNGTFNIANDFQIGDGANQTTVDGLANNPTINIGGNFTLKSNANFNAPSNINLSGGWNNNGGTFTPGNGTVTLNGDSLIQGNTTFNNLTAVTGGKTISFSAGSTQTITGTWSISGSSGHNINLRGSGSSGNWIINPAKAVVSHASISQSTNSGIQFCANYSIDVGGNIGWQIGSSTICEATPAAPTGASVVGVDTTFFTLNWIDNSSSETGFNIFISTATSDNCEFASYPDYPDYALGANTTSQFISGKSVNTQYCARITATNSGNDSPGSYTAPFYTLANQPNAPMVNALSSNSLKIIINSNNNPPSTQYAIYNQTSGKYVQADGSLGNSAVWQTRNVWGGSSGIINYNLLVGTQYDYLVKAKNGDSIETSFSSPGENLTLPDSPKGGDSPVSNIASIAIDPVTATIGPNETLQFKARAFTLDNKEISNVNIVWSVVNGGGAIDKNGFFTAGPDTGTYNNTIEASVGESQSFATVIIKNDTIINNLVDGIVKSATLISGVINTTAGQIEKIYQAVGISKQAATPITSAAALGAAGMAAAMTPMATASSLFSLNEIYHVLSYSILSAGTLKRKKKKWGRVIENGTGMPLYLAQVSLVKVDDADTEKVIESSFTDKDGVYGFAAGPGKYRVIASKEKHTVASIEDQFYNFDPKKIFNVLSYEEGLIVPTIIMNVNGKKLGNIAKLVASFRKLERYFVYFSFVLLALGSILAANNVIHEHTLLNYVIVVGYFLLWIINASFIIRNSPWSIVAESNTGEPVPLTLIRVMNSDSHKLVRTTVSDQKGKFSAMLRKGKYNIFAAKEGYELDHPVEFANQDNMAALRKKLELKKKSIT